MKPIWTTACRDWEQRVIERQSLVPFPPLFPEAAAQAMAVFKALRLVDVTGSPTMGEASRQWVLDFVQAIFGAYDQESGRRLIQEFFLLISKKNTKSTTAAGIMLSALILNWRLSGEFAILAPTIEIANHSFWPARDMIRAEPELSDLLHVQEHYRTITHRTTGATLKVVAADSETVGGKKSIGVLVDELWLFGKREGAENMLREACGGLASRPEGFVIYLSTQSDEPPAGIFAQKLQYARGVRDGRIKDDKFLPVLYEFPEHIVKERLYRDPKVFYMTNPNLGASVDEEFLEREYSKAEEAGEDSLRGFLSKHANVEIGMALAASRWAGASFWTPSDAAVTTLDELVERSEVITIGLDGGGLDDLFGFCALGRERGTQRWLHWGHAWAHPMVLERNKKEAPRFRDFERDGDLTIVSNIGEDVSDIVALIKQVEDSGKLDKLGVDQHGIGAVLEAIEEEDIMQDRIIGIPQGWKLQSAIKTTERKLAEGALIVGPSRLMSWCVGNARVEPRGNAILITKAASGTAKIDPLMATFSAATLMALNPQQTQIIEQGFVVI